MDAQKRKKLVAKCACTLKDNEGDVVCYGDKIILTNENVKGIIEMIVYEFNGMPYVRVNDVEECDGTPLYMIPSSSFIIKGKEKWDD